MTGVWEDVGLVKLVNDENFKFSYLLFLLFDHLTLYITTCYIFFLLNHKHKRLADVLRLYQFNYRLIS